MAQPAVPSDYKPITPFLARASELSKAEPAISYWCSYHALQAAMSLKSKSPEATPFLLSLMDKLEKTKEELKDNEAVTNDVAAAAYIENFALKVFVQADREDRAGKATRTTAKKFLAAANFLELLSIFGETDPESLDKIKYSKWKAADISKAFREGRTPTPGPAGGLDEENASGLPPSSDIVTSEEAKELEKELAELGSNEERQDRVSLGGNSPAQSTRRATAMEKSSSNDTEPAAYPFPATPTSFSPAIATAPMADDEEQAVTPAVPSFLNTPRNEPSASSSGSETPSSVPTSHQTSVLPPPPTTSASAFPAAVFPPAPPVLPPPPPVVPTLSHTATPESLDPAVVGKIQKHAKWAISALNYDDYETARKELRLALSMLGG